MLKWEDYNRQGGQGANPATLQEIRFEVALIVSFHYGTYYYLNCGKSTQRVLRSLAARARRIWQDFKASHDAITNIYPKRALSCYCCFFVLTVLIMPVAN